MARNKVFDKNEVLDKALHVFWHKGYNGTSMQDLVDGLEISRSSMYDTYTGKKALFIAALNKYSDDQAKALIEIISNSTSISETIKAFLQSLVKESVEDESQKGCFIINCTIETAPHDKDVAAIVSSNMQRIEDALCKAIKKGQQAGNISNKHSARALARFLFNAISGLRVAAKAGADKKVFNDIVNVTVATFLKG